MPVYYFGIRSLTFTAGAYGDSGNLLSLSLLTVCPYSLRLLHPGVKAEGPEATSGLQCTHTRQSTVSKQRNNWRHSIHTLLDTINNLEMAEWLQEGTPWMHGSPMPRIQGT